MGIYDTLHDLIAFLQIKNREKQPWKSVLLVKLQAEACEALHILLKVTNEPYKNTTCIPRWNDVETWNTHGVFLGKTYEKNVHGYSFSLVIVDFERYSPGRTSSCKKRSTVGVLVFIYYTLNMHLLTAFHVTSLFLKTSGLLMFSVGN